MSQKNDDIDDFSEIAVDGISAISWLLVLLITMIYLLVSTDVFNKSVLSKLNKDFLDETGEKSTSGFIITGIIQGIVTAIIFAARAYV